MNTKNFYMQIIPGVDNAFGFGDTDDTYEKRQKGSDYTKVGGYGFALGKEKWELFGWWENQTVIDRENHQDKEVHKFIMTIPTMRQKDEVFVFDETGGLTLEIVRDMIEREFFTETSDERVSFSPRPHQRAFLAKAQAEYLEFLLFAKCRAGKSLMCISHVKQRGHKVTLVVSRFTSARQSWASDVNQFSGFEGMVFVDLKDNKNYVEEIEYWMNTDKQILMFDTVQGVISKIDNLNIDFLIYDEAHIGAKDTAKQWSKVKESIDCPILYATGTAYKMVDDFSDANTFVYSYFEEQLDKKRGILKKCPSMNVYLAKYESDAYREIFGDDPAAMKNLFMVDDEGEFVQPSLVSEFVSRYFSPDRTIRPNDRLLNRSRRLYITLPGVKECHAFAKMLKGTRFAPLVVTSDSKNTPDQIKKHLDENNDAAIITRTANVLGVTADVDTVINCAEGASVEFWTQFAFRGGSGENDWRVIDFVPQRCLESLRQMYVLACENEPSVGEFVLTDYVNISEWDNGFTAISQDEVNAILASDPSNAVRLVSGLASALDADILSGIEFDASLTTGDNNVAKNVVVNDNDANGDSAKKRVADSNEKQKSDTAANVKHVQAILERVPLAILHMIMEGNVPTNISDILSSEAYLYDTGDDEGVLSTYIKCDARFGNILNRRVCGVVTDIESSMNNDVAETLEQLSIYCDTNAPIPATLLETMIPSPNA